MNNKIKKRTFRGDDELQRKMQRTSESVQTPAVTFGSGIETNAQRLEMRNKQIQYGKNTVGYDNYLAAVPREKRKSFTIHPRTPNPYEDVSKRAFDGQIKAWRRELHKWDNMEQVLVIGVNNKQSATQVGKDPLVKAEDKDIALVFEVQEEIKQDSYCSDGENFEDENLL